MVSRARNWAKMGGIYSFREKGGRAGVADFDPLFEGGLSGAEGVRGNPVRARPPCAFWKDLAWRYPRRGAVRPAMARAQANELNFVLVFFPFLFKVLFFY